MPKKLTYNFVKEQFEKIGYTLLSKEYINNSTKLEYICDKGHKNNMAYDNFSQGKRCPDCANCKKHTIEFIKSEFEKIGYTLLTKDYINAKQKLDFICNNGHKYKITWDKFKSGERCIKCTKGTKFSYEYVYNIFKEYNYTLLTNEYIQSRKKLKVLCDNGHEYITTLNAFNEGTRCKYCTMNIPTIDEIKIKFEKVGYKLLSTNYKDNRTKLEYICDKGHHNFISFYEFLTSKYKCSQCYKENHKGDKIHLWKGGVYSLNLPLFDTYAHQIDFCEDVRRDPDNNDLLQVRCTNCSEWFTPTRVEVCSRRNALKGAVDGEGRFYCSKECKDTCSIYGKVLHPKGFKPNYSREVQPELAAMVLERDGYECQRCGSKADLECHHYESIYSNPIESADIDACVTLCHQCHKKAHKDKGCRYIDLHKNKLCA